MKNQLILISIFSFSSLAHAGLHSSLEPTNPLPAKWRGFLPDHRTLRMVAVDPATKIGMPTSTLRESYTDLVLTLDAASKSRILTAKESTD